MKVGDLVKDGWGNVSIILKVTKPADGEHWGRVYVFVTKSGGTPGGACLPSGRQFSYNYDTAQHYFTILSRA